MIVSLVVAMDEKRGIGINNRLPWHLSDDLRRFKRLTLGHHLVMGRKTFETIGRPLAGRTSIIVTRNLSFRPEGCLTSGSVEEAIQIAKDRGESEVFIIGGGQIYEKALPLADRIYATIVHAAVEADTYFPEYDRSQWREQYAEFHPPDEKNEHSFTFKQLERIA